MQTWPPKPPGDMGNQIVGYLASLEAKGDGYEALVEWLRADLKMRVEDETMNKKISMFVNYHELVEGIPVGPKMVELLQARFGETKH